VKPSGPIAGTSRQSVELNRPVSGKMEHNQYNTARSKAWTDFNLEPDNHEHSTINMKTK
jgi:hypothetical protein